MRTFVHTSTWTARAPLRHAIVLGGSVAGLLAARVLSDHFERVTLIERDELMRRPEPRKGVPQGNHLHILLARGRMIAEALLPGLSDELLAAGAVRLNAGRDLAWHHSGDWRVRHDSDLFFLSMSRPLLESRIAERVRALPNVTVLDNVRVIGLRSAVNRVTGVRLAKPAGSARADEIGANLVVDAMGRGSSTPQWLMELGFAAPPTELVGARVSYATCAFRRVDQRPDRRAVVVTGKPARRSGLMFPIEGDQWLVTLPGFFNEPMPRDQDAFRGYARSLPVPDIDEAIRGCEPLSAIKHHGFAGSLRRRYELLDRLPEGLIALGDAVCSFNPVYGQGMTVGAIEAEALGQALAKAQLNGGLDPGFSRRWFQMVKPVVDAAWTSVRLEDFRFPELARQRPPHLRPLQWYMERVQRATHHSAFVTDRFYRVMNFLEPSSKLLSPWTIAEVLVPGFGATSRGRACGDAPLRRSAVPGRAG